MEPKQVLIVEPDSAFALSLASVYRADGHATRVAATAAEAELEIATRRPDLVVVRAELPDLSGFSLCARFRHDPVTARLPVVLYSSETPPESLAEHARTPWAANGYLAMPLDTAALRVLSGRILSAAEPVESADDAVLDDAGVEARERRLLVTSDTRLAATPRGPRTVLLHANDTPGQLRELVEALGLAAHPGLLTRCLVCNTRLRNATADEVEERVPDYVRSLERVFRACPGCGRIYWAGTHRRGILAALESTLPGRKIEDLNGKEPR